MKLKNFKGLPGSKPKEKDAESGVIIEGTTAEQLAEMQKRLDSRKKNMEDATRQIMGLAAIPDIDIDDEALIGPHGPILELTVEDIPDDDEDLLGPIDEATTKTGAPQLIELTTAETPSSEEDSELKAMMDVPVHNSEENEEEGEAADEKSDLSDSFSDLFGNDEDEEDPLANLIKNLPDVSAQELLDDIEEIKGIIQEWQHGR